MASLIPSSSLSYVLYLVSASCSLREKYAMIRSTGSAPAVLPLVTLLPSAAGNWSCRGVAPIAKSEASVHTSYNCLSGVALALDALS